MRSKEVLLDNISHNIKILRKHYHYSQEDFSDFLDIKRSSLASYEEMRAFPPIVILLKLSNICDYSINDMCLRKFKIVRKMSNKSFHETIELEKEL